MLETSRLSAPPPRRRNITAFITHDAGEVRRYRGIQNKLDSPLIARRWDRSILVPRIRVEWSQSELERFAVLTQSIIDAWLALLIDTSISGFIQAYSDSSESN